MADAVSSGQRPSARNPSLANEARGSGWVTKKGGHRGHKKKKGGGGVGSGVSTPFGRWNNCSGYRWFDGSVCLAFFLAKGLFECL